MGDLIVAKFGGTSVATARSRQAVIRQLTRLRAEGKDVIAVVSAMGRKGSPYATDTLLSLLRSQAEPLIRDRLISCGETIAACVLADELCAAGIPARPFTAETAGIRTDNNPGEANITEIDGEKLSACLQEGILPVITGFQGILPNREVTTLGRGGSDTSAVEIGGRMGAKEVLIYTDVPGVAVADPRIWPEAPYLKEISCSDMEALALWGASVIHPRAVAAGKRFSVPIRVLSAEEEGEGTRITAKDRVGKGFIGAALKKGTAECVLSILARPFPPLSDALIPEGAVCSRENGLLHIRVPAAAAEETLRNICHSLQDYYSEDSL